MFGELYDDDYRFKPFVFKRDRYKEVSGDGNKFPKPRSGHRIVSFKSSIFSFGGYNPKISKNEYDDDMWQHTYPLFQELWQYNTLNKKWFRFSCWEGMPLELASHSAISQGPHMLVYGGTAMPFGDTSSNKLYICHLPTGKWTLFNAGGHLPEPMYGQAVCVNDNKLYVVGGTTGHLYNLDVHCLDLKEQKWEHLIPNTYRTNRVPDHRYRHEIIIHDDKLIVFGGGQSDAAFWLDDLPTFDIEKQTWFLIHTSPDSSTNSFPRPRRCHVLQRDEEYVYIHGGYDGDTAFRDFWRLDLNTLEWKKLPCITDHPLYFHASTITDEGCMYMFGGVDNMTSNERTDHVLRVWLKIPKLQRLCWEALCHYAPHLPNLSSNTLLEIGIPAVTVDELHHTTPAYG